VKPLSPDQLVRRCDPGSFPFETTAELPDADAFFGQQRAVEAVGFGIRIRREGFNLYVMGPPGIGKQSLVEHCLQAERAGRPAPSDWCYVMNFADARKPRTLCVPAGRGAGLRRDMAAFVDELKTAIPAIFESDEYRARHEEIDQTYAEREQAAFRALGEEAQQQGIALLRTPGGFALAPLRNGEVIDPEEYEKLPEEEKARTGKLMAELHERLHKLIREVPQWGRERRERIRALNHEFTRYAVDHLIEEVKAGFQDLPQVLDYLDQVSADVVDNAELFVKTTDAAAPLPGMGPDPSGALRRYQVNLLVDHGGAAAAPVVLLDHCGLADLVGRIEYVAQLGALVTDFTLLKAGALHRANGGYLLLDALKVLTQPFAWEALKRCLRGHEIRMDSLADYFGLVSTVSLEPEPLPLDVKVVLFGDRLLYYLLHEYDPDFRELFKVQADFSDRLPRCAEGIDFYARFIATVCRREGLVAFDRTAVARVVDHGARLGEDSEKLSAHLQDLADLLREADYWAHAGGKAVAGRDEVERAIAARIARADRLRDEVHEAILRDILIIDTDPRVGQVNGLSVLRLGDFEFAEPTRITATVRLGEGDVVDIQREVEMGGAIHSKGVMILASFLGARFARTAPLSLAASLVFEQTYEPVEGDSASVAELCALMSALAEVPLRQSLAVTGSVDQHGRVQAIGAVNEKIEGFFDLCSKRGLTGAEGVLIPAANVTHLMLREDVVDAVRAERFAVYAVTAVDEALELLTGLPAGAPDARGVMAEYGINARVHARLHEFSLIRRDYGRRGKHRFVRHD
jgi:predicted ATP-dependent protease